MKIDAQQREQGVAILIVLFMISFLLIFVIANGNALLGLKREVRLLDHKQKAHWAEAASKTNRVSDNIKPATNP
jgi:hypothetical protein